MTLYPLDHYILHMAKLAQLVGEDLAPDDLHSQLQDLKAYAVAMRQFHDESFGTAQADEAADTT